MNIFSDIIYYFYQRRLFSEIAKNDIMPSHVGLIMDGNRRFAREKGEEASVGHRKGADKLDELLMWCESLSIPMITIWALSTENLQRQSDEISGLLNIIENKIVDISNDPRTHSRKMKISSLGRTDLLPASTQEALQVAEKNTNSYDDYFLNVAVGYGGRQEIADAFKKLVLSHAGVGGSVDKLVEEITPESISEYLYTVDLPDPDLIIRTSGESRLSGFLLWQSAYSEYYFCDAFWPAFRQIDFLRAIRNYQKRQRRFGL